MKLRTSAVRLSWSTAVTRRFRSRGGVCPAHEGSSPSADGRPYGARTADLQNRSALLATCLLDAQEWKMATSFPQYVFCLWLLATTVAGQQQPAEISVDAGTRRTIVTSLAAKIEAGYVNPEVGRNTARNLLKAEEAGAYNGFTAAKAFAGKITVDLRSATQDGHIAFYFDPESSVPPQSGSQPAGSRERFNFGFFKVERLDGNIGYLDLRSFANLEEGRETASTYLDALANFDAIIIDLRNNGGGNTPMVGYVASYLFGPKPVHLTDMYWRDRNQNIEVWTEASISGRRSATQDLYLLIGPNTFSAAEDFCYSLQQLKRATLVGERTGGGAHMGRGLQRLSPLFTAFIPTGESRNPITKTNWENIGVQPDVRSPAERALAEAHALALKKLIERETDPKWKGELLRALNGLTIVNGTN